VAPASVENFREPSIVRRGVSIEGLNVAGVVDLLKVGVFGDCLSAHARNAGLPCHLGRAGVVGDEDGGGAGEQSRYCTVQTGAKHKMLTSEIPQPRLHIAKYLHAMSKKVVQMFCVSSAIDPSQIIGERCSEGIFVLSTQGMIYVRQLRLSNEVQVTLKGKSREKHV